MIFRISNIVMNYSIIYNWYNVAGLSFCIYMTYSESQASESNNQHTSGHY